MKIGDQFLLGMVAGNAIIHVTKMTLQEVKNLIAGEVYKPEAIRLYGEGWRLTGWEWRWGLTDTSNEVILEGPGKKHGYWADGANRHTEEAFGIIGLPNNDESDDILSDLSEITEKGEAVMAPVALESAIGDAKTAAIVSEMLGVDLPAGQWNEKLASGDKIIVVLGKSPKIEFRMVEVE